MITWLNLLLPLLAETIAAKRTKGILRSYFLAQIGCTLSCWISWQLWGTYSNWYRVVYSLATLAVLSASFMLVLEAGANLWTLFLSTMFSVPLGFWFYRGTIKHDADFWIVALEGLLLAFLGAALALRCHLVRNHAYVILAVLWFALAIYDGGWILNPRSEVLNSLLPAYLVSVGSLAIALHSK